MHDFEKWIGKASAKLEAAKTSKDDSAFWLYSSGSTGFPKGCVHLQHDMIYCLECYAKSVLGIAESDIGFSAAKMFFAYGLGNGPYFPFGVEASVVHYPGRPLAEEMFKVVEKYRPTIFFGVPTLYASMLHCPMLKNASISPPCVSVPRLARHFLPIFCDAGGRNFRLIFSMVLAAQRFCTSSSDAPSEALTNELKAFAKERWEK